MSIKNNIANLQNLLETVNALPEASNGENLEAEISTQATLLSEQDAKIAELAQVLAGKAGSGSGNLNTANITVNISYGTTFRYIGPDGPVTLSSRFGNEIIQVVIPSICFIRSANDGTAGFSIYNVSGGCSTIFNNNLCACVEITSSDAVIKAISNAGGSGGSG